jgi:hypothetical protein
MLDDFMIIDSVPATIFYEAPQGRRSSLFRVAFDVTRGRQQS